MPREFPDKISSNVKTKQGTVDLFYFLQYSRISQGFLKSKRLVPSIIMMATDCDPKLVNRPFWETNMKYLTVFIPGKSLIYSERLTTLLWSTLVCLNF